MPPPVAGFELLGALRPGPAGEPTPVAAYPVHAPQGGDLGARPRPPRVARPHLPRAGRAMSRTAARKVMSGPDLRRKLEGEGVVLAAANWKLLSKEDANR
jgi:hypothetical protein